MDGKENIKPLDVRVGQFTTEDNLTLYYNCWPGWDENAPCAIYLHGLESHMGWFFNLAEYLNSKGIHVYAFDRRGSGLNRESCKNFCSKYILSDLKTFIDLVKKEHPESKIFLVGLCLGGKIAVSFASLYQNYVDGLLLISPSLNSRLKFSLADILAILFMPNKLLRIPIEDSMFTSNERYLKHIKKDALRMHYVPAEHLKEIIKMDRYVRDSLKSMRLPVLLMLAGRDDIIDTRKIRAWYQRLPAKDKALKVYKDFYHILTFEKDAEEVMDDAARWILARSND